MEKTSQGPHLTLSTMKNNIRSRPSEATDVMGGKKQLQYLIKWKGYPESDNTWEPADHVQAPQLIRQYERRQENSIKVNQVQPLHHPPNWGAADVPASAPNQRGLLPFTSTLRRSYKIFPTLRTPSMSSHLDAPTGPS
jgi:hypothetical protein